MSDLNDLLATETGATFSPDRNYRYVLWRRWEQNALYVLFIGLNKTFKTK